MEKVICATGRPVWVTLDKDACFEEYGYYYEVYADENGDSILDWGNTHDPEESYESAWEWLISIVERSEY